MWTLYRMPLSLLWLVVYLCDHQGVNQKSAAETQSEGKTFLVSPQDGQGKIEPVASDFNSTSPQYPSFQGRSSDQSHFKRNHGELRALEVQVLQEDFQSVRKWMQSVPDTLARRVRIQNMFLQQSKKTGIIIKNRARARDMDVERGRSPNI